MKTLTSTALFVLAFLVPTADAAAERVSVTRAERLANLEYRRSGGDQPETAELRTRASVSFDALGRRFDMELEPNTGLLSPEALARIDGRFEVYRGRLSGEPGSWVRLVMDGGVPSGMLYDGRELYGIEVPDDAAHGSDQPAIFRVADMQVQAGAMSCGVGDPINSNGALRYQALIAELKTAFATGPGAVEEIQVGALGDEEFNNIRLDPTQSIINRLNNVDGIYSSELGIQITVPPSAIEIFDDTNDPFTDTTDSSDLLDEVATYRRNSTLQRDQGLTHLFTGRDLDGSTVGVAFLGVLCSNNFGVGLTEATTGLTNDSLIAAHEIGHNFGADHDGDPDGACPTTDDVSFIMAPRVGGGNTFSSCSRDVMSARAAQAACITPLPTVDARVTSFDQPENVFLGNVITLNFDVENRGSLTANNVALDIDLPTNVTFQSAATSSQACTSGAGTVSCSIGTVAGGSTETVTLTAGTDAAGTARFTATVSADSDANQTNNVDIHDVVITSAVNLVANAPSSPSVVVNQQTSSSLSIENTSVVEATGVTATITVDAGLQADSASWSAGNCSVNGSTVTCTAASLAAQSNSTLTLTVTGITTGTQGFTVSLTADQQDADATNDTVSGTVTVTAANNNNNGNNGNNDDGGGSFGLPLLTVLALGGLMGRRRRYRR